MRLSDERIEELNDLLKAEGIHLPSEKIAEAGFSILRFVIAKTHKELSINMETNHDKQAPQ